MNNKIKLSVAAIAAAFAAPVAFADTPTAVAPVVVTATRVEQSSFDVPGAIDVIGSKQISDGQPGVNLSETLWRAPGTVVLNRQNYAQDLQVSMRGFGARSAFGTRSIRIMQDGIPLTMPDGQGQTGSFDLANAQRIEVLRGPFSAAYGNQSGGVIQLFTADGPKEPTVEARAFGGAYGTWDTGLKAGGQSGNVNYTADANHFHTDGYRDHSSATRDSSNAKVKFSLANDATLTLMANWLKQSGTQDAMGLKKSDFLVNPRQAIPDAFNFNTRKDIDFTQGGAVYEQALGAGDALRLSAYTGVRKVTQYQNTCINNPTPLPKVPTCQNTIDNKGNIVSPGGVVAYDRDFGGVGGSWTRNRDTWRITAGMDYEAMHDDRKGYNNFTGTFTAGKFVNTTPGVMGALRRDEDDKVNSLNTYVEGEWKFAPTWAVTGGLRNTRVSFSSADHYVVGDGADGSGSLYFQNTSPMVGLLWKPTAAVNFFANVGRGFETPTFTEMSYKPDNSAGLNFALKPSRSRSMEAGMKAFVTADSKLEATLFDVETADEIVVFANSGGRTSYQNAGRTGRQGVELSWDADLGHGFGAFAAYTRMKAIYRDAFGTALAGNTIAGMPTTMLHGEVSWKYAPAGFSTALEFHHVGQMFVNDANDEAADGYDVASLRAGFDQQQGKWKLKEFVRCDNLTDRQYAGSVIVNQAQKQYYEPAPGRNWTVGASASYRF